MIVVTSASRIALTSIGPVVPPGKTIAVPMVKVVSMPTTKG
jgi:hypothetical protein